MDATRELLKCAICKCALRRPNDKDLDNIGRRLVYTRTLVPEGFLPSCSFECAQLMRSRINHSEC